MLGLSLPQSPHLKSSLSLSVYLLSSSSSSHSFDSSIAECFLFTPARSWVRFSSDSVFDLATFTFKQQGVYDSHIPTTVSNSQQSLLRALSSNKRVKHILRTKLLVIAHCGLRIHSFINSVGSDGWLWVKMPLRHVAPFQTIQAVVNLHRYPCPSVLM